MYLAETSALMGHNLQSYRKSYEKSELLESEVSNYPLALFSSWFEEAEASGTIEEVNAVGLSTLGKDGFPKTRIVLLKEYNETGFVIYTNYSSEKGQSIANYNKVCLSFFWPSVERQVIIKGQAEKVSEEKSKDYFNQRPRGSQIGAWASDQSAPVRDRASLEAKKAEIEKKFQGQEIPKPPFWGGYVISPISYEFWQGRPNRLHDRLLYTKTNPNSWSRVRLAP